MKVKDCRKCPNCERRTWYERHDPKNGSGPRPFGHEYAYCAVHHGRVRRVKKCDNYGTDQVTMLED